MSAAITRRTKTKGQSLREELGLDVLAGKERAEDLRAGVLRAWAKQHHVSPATLTRYPVARHMFAAGHRDADALARYFARQAKITLKHVECIFESVIDQHRRKQQGAVYTPDFIIDYLIKSGLRLRSTKRDVPQFCDPACGSGGFLVRAAELFGRRYRLELPTVFSRHIRGLDNDHWAVQHARCLVSLFLCTHAIAAPSLADRCVIHCDTLLSTAQDVKLAMQFDRGVDLLATNPPYVKLQNLARPYRNSLLEVYSDFAQGSFSLSLLFLIAGQRLLSQDGMLAFITQNNLFTSLAGRPVREHLQASQCLRRVVDFQHERIFADASAYTCLLFLGSRRKEEFQFERITGQVDAASLRKARFTPIRHDRLDPVKWRLAKQPHLDHLQRIERDGVPLGKLAQIRVGFATLKDAVFHLRGTSDPGGGIFRTTDGDCVELGATRRAVKVADLHQQSDVSANQRRVIFPYQMRTGRWQIIAEEQFAGRYPRAYAYLVKHRAALAQRDKGLRRYEAWYAWARGQGRSAPGPKLLTKTFSARPQFMLDTSDQLFCNGYSVSILTQQDAPPPWLTLACLQRVLNSRVMHYYAKLTSVQIDGDYQCYQKNFIERFAVPRMTQTEAQLLKSCEPSRVDALVQQLYGIPTADLQEVVGEDRW